MVSASFLALGKTENQRMKFKNLARKCWGIWSLKDNSANAAGIPFLFQSCPSPSSAHALGILSPIQGYHQCPLPCNIPPVSCWLLLFQTLSCMLISSKQKIMIWATERHRHYQMHVHMWDNFIPTFEFEPFFIWRVSKSKAIGMQGWEEERKSCSGPGTRSYWSSLVIRLFMTPLGAAYFTPPLDSSLHCRVTLPTQVPAAQPSWCWAPRLHASFLSLAPLWHTRAYI